MLAYRSLRTAIIVGLAAGIVLCLRITQPAPGNAHAAPMFNTFTVNSLLDTADLSLLDGVCDVDPGPLTTCTLRAAIQEANAQPGADTIGFTIVGGGTITLLSILPPITDQVTITGTTAIAPPFQPQVRINANDLALGLWFSSNALTTSSNSIVSGLLVRNADAGTTGIAIRIAPGGGVGDLAVSNVTVTGCWLGVNDAGTGAGGRRT